MVVVSVDREVRVGAARLWRRFGTRLRCRYLHRRALLRLRSLPGTHLRLALEARSSAICELICDKI